MANGFIWYELLTTDREAAIAFYEAVVGWKAEDMAIPEMGDYRYTILHAGERGVAGLAALPDESRAEMRPGWFGYVEVPDTDAAVRAIAAAGGKVHMAPDDIPTVGRFAFVADPGGAAFYLLTPLPREDAPPPLPRMTPGNIGWHELYAANGDAAFAFYREQFGWSESSVMDMGPMGTYRLWSADGGGAVGGMMTKPGTVPEATWLFYFVVDSVEAAGARIADNGGTARIGPMQVPDGSWVVQAVDPQGASFALVSERR
jgi:hypothetical protein